jgi:isoleucyl-tRNA synthetase
MTDAVHRGLTGESVHLASYRREQDAFTDEALEAAMADIRALAGLGRAARERADINVRQPLPLVQCVVPANAADAEALGALLASELNVKRVEFVTSTDSLVSLEARPNFRALGKKFGKSTPQVATAEIVESRLSNGMALVSAQTGTVPLATITVVLPGGSATDPAGKAGLAELAAVLADKGTATRSAEQIAATLESLGASMGATPGPDGVFFSVTAPAANLAAAGEVLSDVIQGAAYPEDELNRERARLIDGLRVALKDPGSLDD